MKRIVSVIAVFALAILASCDSGNIIGGRYFGTFHNTNNGLREAGSLSFTYNNIDNTTCFLMNDILPMTQIAENKFTGVIGDHLLNDLLKTISRHRQHPSLRFYGNHYSIVCRSRI